MWFFLAVLLLWGTTAVLGDHQDRFSDLVQWCWWTVCLYLCGCAAVAERFESLAARVMGVFGFTLLTLYYTNMSGDYMDFVPHDPANVDFWPTVFLTVNLLGPLLLVCAGCMRATVQFGRR